MANTHYCSGCGERMDIAVWPTATFHEGCPNDGMWKPLASSAPQVACDHCSQGVMDATNPHLLGTCPCDCHRRYRTIVADPPWPIGDFPAFCGYAGPRKPEHRSGTGRIGVGYETQSVEWISSLAISDIAHSNAHIYLWTINAFVTDAYAVARAWGFRPAQLLTWAKAPRGMGPGGTFANTTEFVLFCRRGTLKANERVDRTCWDWPRPYSSRGTIGSAKPDAFYDLVERVSPGPYLELFSRRARLGWDTWGDEALHGTELIA